MAQPEENRDVLTELASLPTLAHPKVSPDGTKIAFYYDVTGRNELHVLDMETGEQQVWSDGEVPRSPRWDMEWAGDGDAVYFHSDEDGDEQNDVYRLTRDGETEPVVTMDCQVIVWDVSEDDESLLLSSNRDGQMNAFHHDILGDETTKLTNHDRSVEDLSLSPEGDRFTYSTNETEEFNNRDVYVGTLVEGDLADVRRLPVGETGAQTKPVGWGPAGDRLLLSDSSEDLGRAGVYHLQTNTIEWYGSGEFEETPALFLPDGERIVTKRARGARTVPVVYDLETGHGYELDLPEGVTSHAGGRGVLADGRIVLKHTTAKRRPELLAYDTEADEYETLFGAEYGPFDPEDFADAEYISVESDGVPETPAHAVDHDPYKTYEIGALLYDSGERPSPLVVNPHGGPPSRSTKSFDPVTQFLVSLGFSVLQPNFRGSTGRGQQFVDELVGDWGGAEQGDIATVTESVIELDWIDDDRVAVFGGSFGGYAAYWQLVQYPELYHAGVAFAGTSDLPDQYENSMPHFRTELAERYLGTPEENPELYQERSPTTHADNLDADLLILHGVNDPRAPVSQARLFRDELEAAGYEEGEGGAFEYRELEEEGHGSTDADHTLRLFRILEDFLNRRLGTRRAITIDD